MFPVRRELVGKRFAFIRGDGRTGTRHRGSQSGLSQNWNELSWVTGTILAANVDGLDAQNESVISKKVKVFVQYDNHYQLEKEWIKLYSGSHRIFLIEENLVLCRRNNAVGYSRQSYDWPALRLVPILDRNFLDDNPHLIPVEFMGARKQLSFIVLEDIIKLFPNEDQTLLLQSVQQDIYLKSDYQSWERIQKTQMILLYGPYSLTGCRVEVNDPSSGRCYRAVIISHDYMKRVLDVMDDQLLKSRKISPKLVQINFLASDEDIDKLMYGEAPKAIPTRYSRYGHQVQPSGDELDKGTSNQQLSQFTLPQWMTNNSLINQDQHQSNQPPHGDYQQDGVMPGSQLSNVIKHCDERQLESSSVGLLADRGRSVIDLQSGMQKQEQLSSPFAETQLIGSNDGLHQGYRSAFSPKSIDANQLSSNLFKPKFGPHLQHSQVTHHFRSSSPSLGMPSNCLDRPMPERPGTAPCIDTRVVSCYSPSSTLSSPKGQINDIYPLPQTPSNNIENSPVNFEQHMPLGCFQSPHFTRDTFEAKRHSLGMASPKGITNTQRSYTDLRRRSSLPEGFKVKEQAEFLGGNIFDQGHSNKHMSSNDKQQEKKRLQIEKPADKLTNKPMERLNEVPLDGTMQHQVSQHQAIQHQTMQHPSMQHQSMQHQSVSITQNDLAHFLSQLDACFNSTTRIPQQSMADQAKNFSSANQNEHLMSINSKQSNSALHRDDILAHIQHKVANSYSPYQSHDPRVFQEMYEQHLNKQIFGNQSMTSLNQSHNWLSAPPSHLTRSLSSDNFQVRLGQFSMSPPSVPLKKPKGRGKRKSRSKDDTSKPSSEASKKVSSLLLSSKRGEDEKSNKSEINKEKTGKSKDASDKTRIENKSSNEKEAIVDDSSLKELEKGKAEEKNEDKTEQKDEILSKQQGEPVNEQDMTARVALAIAGFNHGSNNEINKQYNTANIGEQKIPTGAKWFENVESEISKNEIARGKAKTNADEIVSKKGDADYECLDKAPSPEFLPMKDAPLDEMIKDLHDPETPGADCKERGEAKNDEKESTEMADDGKEGTEAKDDKKERIETKENEKERTKGNDDKKERIETKENEKEKTETKYDEKERTKAKDDEKEMIYMKNNETRKIEIGDDKVRRIKAMDDDKGRTEAKGDGKEKSEAEDDEKGKIETRDEKKVRAKEKDDKKAMIDTKNDEKNRIETRDDEKERAKDDKKERTEIIDAWEERIEAKDDCKDAVKETTELNKKTFEQKEIVEKTFLNGNLPDRDESIEEEVNENNENQLNKPDEEDNKDGSLALTNTASHQMVLAKQETAMSKVPISSMPVTALDINLGNIFDPPKKQEKTTNVVRNIYGRTLYQTPQRGPNFAKQLRTDKIIEVVSSDDKKNESKNGVQPGVKTDSTVNNEANEGKECSNSTPKNSLKELLQSTHPVDISNEAQSTLSADQSTPSKDSSNSLKQERITKICTDKTPRNAEKKTKICKHKRKPCKCDLEKAIASLPNDVIGSGQFSSTIHSLQRLAIHSQSMSDHVTLPNPMSDKLSTLLQRPQHLLTNTQNAQFVNPSSEEQGQLQQHLQIQQQCVEEPSFSILESKEVTEEINNETKSLPTGNWYQNDPSGNWASQWYNNQLSMEQTNRAIQSSSGEGTNTISSLNATSFDSANMNPAALNSGILNSPILTINNLSSNLNNQGAKNLEPRSSKKCRHKRRPCRCDIEAATKLSDYLKYLKDCGTPEFSDTLKSYLERTPSPIHIDPRSSSLETTSLKSLDGKFTESGSLSSNLPLISGNDVNDVSPVFKNPEVDSKSLKVTRSEVSKAGELTESERKNADLQRENISSSPLLDGTERKCLVKEGPNLDHSMNLIKELAVTVAGIREGKQSADLLLPIDLSNLITKNKKQLDEREKGASSESFDNKIKFVIKRTDMKDGIKRAEKDEVMLDTVAMLSDPYEKELEKDAADKQLNEVKTKTGPKPSAVANEEQEIGSKIDEKNIEKIKNENAEMIKDLKPVENADNEGEGRNETVVNAMKMEESGLKCESTSIIENKKEEFGGKEKVISIEGIDTVPNIKRTVNRSSLKEDDTALVNKAKRGSCATSDGFNSREDSSSEQVSRPKELKDPSMQIVNENVREHEDLPSISMEEKGKQKNAGEMPSIEAENDKKDSKCFHEKQPRKRRGCIERKAENRRNSEIQKSNIVKSKSEFENGIGKMDKKKGAEKKKILNVLESGKEGHLLKGNGKTGQKADLNNGDGKEKKIDAATVREKLPMKNVKKEFHKSIKVEKSCAAIKIRPVEGLSSPVQSTSNNTMNTQPVAASGSLKITVPANFALSSNILNTPGQRITARAKVVCPEKTLMPLKGGPVSVSFDGGKTFTLASIVEIRNRSNENILNKSEEKQAENKEKPVEGKEESNNEETVNQPTTIDAVLLAYSSSETSRENVKGKSEKLYKSKTSVKKKKRTSKKSQETDDSSEDDVDERILKERSGVKSVKEHRELRRSSRFLMKNGAEDYEKNEKKFRELENDNDGLIGKEETDDYLFAPSESEISLSEDDPNFQPVSKQGEKDGKKRRCMTEKTLTEKKSENEKIKEEIEQVMNEDKKTTQTSKDEMFDCCAIHQDLFCKKCIRFKMKEGFWPASSRAKEVNTAWRNFVRRCDKHESSKCNECNDIVVVHDESVEETVAQQIDVSIQTKWNNDQMTQTEEAASKTGAIYASEESEDKEKRTIENEKKNDCIKEELNIKREGNENIMTSGKKEDEIESVENIDVGSKKEAEEGLEKPEINRNIKRSSRLKLKHIEGQFDMRSGAHLESATIKVEKEDGSVQDLSSGKKEIDAKKKTKMIPKKETDISSPELNELDRKIVSSKKLQRKRKVAEIEEEKPKTSKSKVKKPRKDGKEKELETSLFGDVLFDVPAQQCPIHGRKLCRACRPFYEREGEWPGWPRRGEVQFHWELRDKDVKKRHTVKCRIHLKANCSRCMPFRDKKGLWPSWLKKDEVEEHYMKSRMLKSSKEARATRIKPKGTPEDTCEGAKYTDPSALSKRENSKKSKDVVEEMKGTGSSGLSKKESSKKDLCFLHERYYCLRCYEMRKSNGKWPKDDELVKRSYKGRQKKKANMLAKWNKCVIHKDQICLPCFNFWKKAGRAPFENDQELVDELWESVVQQIADYTCIIHKKYFCKACTPVFLEEEDFPNIENHLKSLYSWKLFGDFLSQYPEEELQEKEEDQSLQRKKKKTGKQDLKRGATILPQINKKSGSDNEDRKRLIRKKSNLKVSKKFHCTLHTNFPCFVCMPKFVKDGRWPDEMEVEELWQKWICEWSDDVKCSAHDKMFCRKCYEVASLFKKYRKLGVTDVFLDLVKKDLQSRRESKAKTQEKGSVGEGPKKRGRKRKLKTSGETCDDDEKVSVSLKGRVRSKVLRPGTVDISELAEDFIDRRNRKESENDEDSEEEIEMVLNKVKKRMKEQSKVCEQMVPIKRKRGRPPKKKVDEPEEPAPKKRRRKRRRKYGLVEQIRSGTLKLINVDDLRDQLENDHERDPSPTHMEYVQLLENAEKMNVKYFAISSDCGTVITENKLEKKIVKTELNIDNTADDKECKDELKNEGKEDIVDENGKSVDDSVTAKGPKSSTKLSSINTWSEREIELILAKVEKAAEAAKAQKEEASHRRKQRQGKRPLTVAQVLAIKRNRGGDTRPVMDENAKADLEKMLQEAERRSVDLDTLLEEAIKTKDKEERLKRIAKQKANERRETFLQDKPCDQTPKLPKCRDCRIVDKRDVDQHAFCRFVMFRRLFKRPKTGKIESAGFCSPASANDKAFLPWISKSFDVDMKASVCHYIIKNIAGQFCAVVEEECQALMLGTKDGAVAWKRAVAGVREMCDACATTIFNIHWVCEKCGFGVCLDCFKSKISEKEAKDEGYKFFEFHWFTCAPGLTHKPHNLTVTQIIPKDALWDLCQLMIDICTSLNIPYKLSENVLKKAMPLGYTTTSSPEKTQTDSISELTDVLSTQQGSIVQEQEEQSSKIDTIESRSSAQVSEGQNLEKSEAAVKTEEIVDDCTSNVQICSISTAPIPCNNTEMPAVNIPLALAKPLLSLMKPLAFGTSNELNDNGTSIITENGAINQFENNPTDKNKNHGDLCVTNDSMEAKLDGCKAIESFDREPSTTATTPACLKSFSEQKPQSSNIDVDAKSSKVIEDNSVFYGLVCKRASSILDKIKNWKVASEMMKETNLIFDDEESIEPNANEQDSDDNQNEMMVRECGNDSLLSDVSMSSDNTEMFRGAGKNEFIGKESTSVKDVPEKTTENISSPSKPEHSFSNTAKSAQERDDTVSSNGHFSEQFQNNLDILAMVASGFFCDSKGNDEKPIKEGHAGSHIGHLSQNTTYFEDKDLNNQPSKMNDSSLLLQEKRFYGHECPVASYLCDGKLLQLNYSRHPKNIELFRSVWKKGLPLIVSRVDDLLDRHLWKPETFAAEFGHELADVVNCRNGEILHQFSVGEFWDGFESVKDRPVDSRGLSMLLKLKDWPPGADFLDKMPKRFDDLMNAIPLPEYTRRDGQWNLVSRLPTNHFIKPDLGPKMYNAYGSAAVPSAGTTNLHLDMSDAVNVMVYVGVPRDPLLGEQEVQDAWKTVDMACCEKTKHRVRQPNVLPGALWHIYAAEDADKIRKFLRKVAEEKKLKFSIHNDPIHDQSFYLDYDLRKRLKAEYDVTGFAICQCLGDAVFIPAGAPHQVLNLHSCVKVAEDFVSPERIGQCFNLTQEFRFLSDRHTNHEDKLQIKNIIYHAVKDSIAVLRNKFEDVKSKKCDDVHC